MIGRVKATGSRIYISVVNQVRPLTTVITGSSEAAEWPASNLHRPERPFTPWRTTATGDQSVVINFGSAKAIDGIWLVRTNFVSVRIQMNNSDSWGAPAVDQLYTLIQNPWNFRYQLGVRLGGTYQFLRIFIPSQTPTDGAAFYLLGGVWAGALEPLPQNVRFDVDLVTVQPSHDVVPEGHQGWRQRLIMGEPLCRISAMRTVRITEMMPGFQDDLNRWQSIARRIRDNDTFAIILGAADSSQAFVVRPINEAHWQWTRRRLLRAESPWDLEESMA